MPWSFFFHGRAAESEKEAVKNDAPFFTASLLILILVFAKDLFF
jgi:hypothetical protein